jgi:hypothetical protein
MSFLKPTVMLLFFSVTLKAFSQTSTPVIPSIHAHTITTINNTSLSLSSLAGKKIVFVIAPLSIRDSAKIRAIKEFQNKYDTSVQVIGILTHELGYKDSLQSKIIALYNNTKPIMLTTAIYATTTPQHAQNSLLKWLLTKAENKVFDSRFSGDMQKFFLDEQGALYHVASPSLEFASPFMEVLINKKTL